MNGTTSPSWEGDAKAGTSILVDLNHATGIVRLFRADGKYIEERVSEPRPDSPFIRAVYMLGLPYVVVTTDRGEDITIELPTLAEAAPLRGRPVVYLDQQAWSKLALARHEPQRLMPAAELEAALWLIDLVESWSVVLPYSSGVLAETAHWSNRERRRRFGSYDRGSKPWVADARPPGGALSRIRARPRNGQTDVAPSAGLDLGSRGLGPRP